MILGVNYLRPTVNTIEIDEGQDTGRLRALVLRGLLILHERMAVFRVKRKFSTFGQG